jgi:hypothetical protein
MDCLVFLERLPVLVLALLAAKLEADAGIEEYLSSK